MEMWRGRSRRNARTPDEVVRLLIETEAFLSGEFLRHLEGRGSAIPGWAWVNALAHGDLRRIRQVRRAGVEQSAALRNWSIEAWTVAEPLEDSWRIARAQEEAWRRAQRVLAEEVLHLVGNDREVLGYLQQTALVPLELHLMERESRGSLSPSDLVIATRSALRSVMS
jgi:hypothetical protein